MLLEPGRNRLRFPRNLAKPAVLIAAYGAWIVLLRLLLLSFLVYFLTRQGHRASFEEINEAFAANEIPFVGVASVLFILLLKGFSPLVDRVGELKVSAREFRTGYLPGFLRGSAVGASVVAAFLLLGAFRFVGFFVQVEDAPLAITAIVVRTLALLAIGYCDELVFRSWGSWESRGPHGNLEPGAAKPGALPRLPLIGIVGIVYCVVKMAQFDELSWMHFATLLLLSATLSVRRLNQKSFLNGAGYCSALLIVFHPLLGLPIFGSDFSGIFLLKYQPQATLPAWISGGAGGPLSGFALQAVLLIEMVRGFLARNSAQKAAQKNAEKKALFKLSTSQ